MAEKSAKVLQYQAEQRNAQETLAAVLGKAPRMANVSRFITHRRADKPNEAFFENLAARVNVPKVKKAAAATVNVAAAAGAAAGAAAAAKNIAVASATKNKFLVEAQKNLTAKFAPYGKKPHIGVIQKLAATRRKGMNNSELIAKINKGLAELGTVAAVEGAAAGAAAVEAAAVEGAIASAKKISGHVAAGKKAATSEKGAAWLANVNRGYANLKNALSKAGRNTKVSRAVAAQQASLARKNAAAAESFKESIIDATAVSKNVKNRLTAARAAGKNAKKNNTTRRNKTPKVKLD